MCGVVGWFWLWELVGMMYMLFVFWVVGLGFCCLLGMLCVGDLGLFYRIVLIVRYLLLVGFRMFWVERVFVCVVVV